MLTFPPSMQKLIRELSRLPSIGEKSATRLAYYLVQHEPTLAKELAEAISVARAQIKLCEKCFFLCEKALCTVCEDSHRDQSLLCVVEKPVDVIALERSRAFHGLYHVLHGVWSPLRGQGPESIKLRELSDRIKAGGIKEVILATGATVEGDATALYIAKLLQDAGVRSTRLAQGIPKGGELEFADDITLTRALAGRSVLGAG